MSGTTRTGPNFAKSTSGNFGNELICVDLAATNQVWAFPGGGEFLMVRAERSRGFMEDVSRGTSWHLRPWLTHREEATVPMPDLPSVDAVLALSPLQAELFGPMAGELRRFAWDSATAKAFEAAGLSVEGSCEPRADALREMLTECNCHMAR